MTTLLQLTACALRHCISISAYQDAMTGLEIVLGAAVLYATNLTGPLPARLPVAEV